MSNTRNTFVEALEHHLPVRIRTHSLRQGSGGAGQYPPGDRLHTETPGGGYGPPSQATPK